MEIKTHARKWGNSIAVILPKDLIDKNKIKENDEIIIKIEKRPLAGELFGKFARRSKKTAQQIKDEMKKGWN
ncbi:AbrB/MazE/SpoVT family DNA-binding domain-containing protein [Candidatus Pacearchaeota archaeon]|nr:AbrB/MazE/SpoVT family DNA-binding domain-containing protein [Candidatus Pacearchaeota archaeon]